MAEIREARDNMDHDLTIRKLEEFFDFEVINERLEVLKNPPESINKLKQDLFAGVQTENIFILNRGETEDYYPSEIPVKGKPAKAQYFCRTYRDKESVYQALNLLHPDGDQLNENNEFVKMFAQIFR